MGFVEACSCPPPPTRATNWATHQRVPPLIRILRPACASFCGGNGGGGARVGGGRGGGGGWVGARRATASGGGPAGGHPPRAAPPARPPQPRGTLLPSPLPPRPQPPPAAAAARGLLPPRTAPLFSGAAELQHDPCCCWWCVRMARGAPAAAAGRAPCRWRVLPGATSAIALLLLLQLEQTLNTLACSARSARRSSLCMAVSGMRSHEARRTRRAAACPLTRRPPPYSCLAAVRVGEERRATSTCGSCAACLRDRSTARLEPAPKPAWEVAAAVRRETPQVRRTRGARARYTTSHLRAPWTAGHPRAAAHVLHSGCVRVWAARRGELRAAWGGRSPGLVVPRAASPLLGLG